MSYQFNPPRQYCNHGWFVSVKNASFLYLHSDGVVRHSTEQHNGQRSGYFPTKRDASLAIVRYMDQQEFSE
jgi:hypothetical protein